MLDKYLPEWQNTPTQTWRCRGPGGSHRLQNGWGVARRGPWWVRLPYASANKRSKTICACLLTHRFCRICKTYASHVLSTKKHSTILRFFLNGQAPKYLIRDNDRKFGPSFARAANTSGIRVLLARAVCGYPLSS